MDEVLKILLLLNYAGADIRSWKKIRELGFEPYKLLSSDSKYLEECGLTERAVLKIREGSLSGWAEKEYEKVLSVKADVITCDDEKYPESLFDLKDAPLVLYIKGSASLLSHRTVGVVGTRKSTSYGREISKRIGTNCSASHISLISGGASGIDGAAHLGTCDAGGRTAAVFGTGIDVLYPASNAALFEKITERGALITEFPTGSGAEPWHFPRRNRLVAALSERLIVVEAPQKSGAMITARIALELGREVWAVPGHIDQEVTSGSNRLIFDGAYPYISDEVFFQLNNRQNSLFDSYRSEEVIETDNLTPDERVILKAMRNKSSQTVDNLADEVKMSAACILKIIAILSAKGIVYSSGPGRFSAKV